MNEKLMKKGINLEENYFNTKNSDDNIEAYLDIKDLNKQFITDKLLKLPKSSSQNLILIKTDKFYVIDIFNKKPEFNSEINFDESIKAWNLNKKRKGCKFPGRLSGLTGMDGIYYYNN